jgi:hypothetical protein
MDSRAEREEQSDICIDTTDDHFWASIPRQSVGLLISYSMGARPGTVITATGDL